MGRVYSWASPEVVSNMTLLQVLRYLEDDGKEGKGRIASKAEIDAHCAAVRERAGLD